MDVRVGRVPVSAKADVAVYGDVGAWHAGLRGVVDALEREHLTVSVWQASAFTRQNLSQVRTVVLPGGWAVLQRDALGDSGLAAIRQFVEEGGTVLGICAGAYLLSRTVVWENVAYPYPLGLFDGVAVGPIAKWAPWPKRAAVRLRFTETGGRKGLDTLATPSVLYYGGPRFESGSAVSVLAMYPDSTAAMVERQVGKGKVVLSAVHWEQPADDSVFAYRAPPRRAGKVLAVLLGL
jgi:biotin--protein ligase